MNCKWIIGLDSSFLDIAHDAWSRAHPELLIKRIIIPQDSQYRFDLESLKDLPENDGTAFVAIDERFGNFKRAELMQAVMNHRIKLASFISPRAAVAGNVQVGPNTFIGDNAVVGLGSRIGYNSVLLPGSRVGAGVQIRNSCWIEGAAVIGDAAQIGGFCILRNGAVVAPRIEDRTRL